MWYWIALHVCIVSGVYAASCRDNNFQCAYWSSVHQCELNPRYMMSTCPRSCENPCVCPVDTDDVACDCTERAKLGHCETQPNVMNVVCKTMCIKRHSVTCPILPHPSDPHAGLSTSKTWFLTQVDEVCDGGYQSVTSANRGRKFCSKLGSWIDDAFYSGPVSCEPVDCGEPPVLTNGERSFNSTIFQGEVVYTCWEGFKIALGNARRTCNESALWSGRQPVCKVVTCPREDLYVPYASFAVSSVTYSSTVTYRCAKGYNRTAGDLQRTCQQNERWSGSAPTCTIIHCPTPAEINKTTLIYSSTEYQSTATYVCILGYKRTTGDQSRYCLETALWSGSDLVCEIVSCGHAPLMAGAKWNSSGEEYLDKAYYECFYQEDQDNLVNWTLVCSPDGQWVGETLKCAAVLKTFLPEPKEADGSYGVGIISLSIVAFILLVIVLLDIPTIMRQSGYLKRNLRRFRKKLSFRIKALRISLERFQSNILLRNKSGIISVKSAKRCHEDTVSFNGLLSMEGSQVNILSVRLESPVDDGFCYDTKGSEIPLSRSDRVRSSEVETDDTDRDLRKQNDNSQGKCINRITRNAAIFTLGKSSVPDLTEVQ